LYQLDIKNAFSKKIFKREYMIQPPSVISFRRKQKKVCKSKKAIYSLKQFPRAWFDKFSTIVAHYGLRRSSSDHSIFIRHSSTGTIIFSVYVDNIVITGDDHQGIIQLKAYLSSHFHMKDLSVLMYFLRIEIARSLKGLSLSQRKHLIDLLKKLIH